MKHKPRPYILSLRHNVLDATAPTQIFSVKMYPGAFYKPAAFLYLNFLYLWCLFNPCLHWFKKYIYFTYVLQIVFFFFHFIFFPLPFLSLFDVSFLRNSACFRSLFSGRLLALTAPFPAEVLFIALVSFWGRLLHCPDQIPMMQTIPRRHEIDQFSTQKEMRVRFRNATTTLIQKRWDGACVQLLTFCPYLPSPFLFWCSH